jgi:Flp pilus assembly protein TadG
VLRLARRTDDGQLTVLVIGFTFILAVLIVVGVDVSKVFLARRSLSSVADAAALAAAQSADRAAIYAGAAACGGVLPLDAVTAAQQVDASLADDLPDLQQTFAEVQAPDVDVVAGTVTVHLSGDVKVPFGRVLALLDPGRPNGRVHVAVSASAESPITAPDGC